MRIKNNFGNINKMLITVFVIIILITVGIIILLNLNIRKNTPAVNGLSGLSSTLATSVAPVSIPTIVQPIVTPITNVTGTRAGGYGNVTDTAGGSGYTNTPVPVIGSGYSTAGGYGNAPVPVIGSGYSTAGGYGSETGGDYGTGSGSGGYGGSGSGYGGAGVVGGAAGGGGNQDITNYYYLLVVPQSSSISYLKNSITQYIYSINNTEGVNSTNNLYKIPKTDFITTTGMFRVTSLGMQINKIENNNTIRVIGGTLYFSNSSNTKQVSINGVSYNISGVYDPTQSPDIIGETIITKLAY